MQCIDNLDTLTKDELLARWRSLPGKQPPPARVDRLLRELAYRLQEQSHGKLEKNTAVSLRRHINSFARSLQGGIARQPAKTPAKVLLESGSVITREWCGGKVTVQILGKRDFLYEGARFKSLSAIAKNITGQHLSGPLFFGLKEVKCG